MTSATSSEVEELLKVVGQEVIRAYRDKYFPPRILQACPTVYSLDNASKWVNFDKFCAFVAHFLQEQSPPPSPGSNTCSSRPEVAVLNHPHAGPIVHRPRKCSTSTYPTSTYPTSTYPTSTCPTSTCPTSTCQTTAADKPPSDTEESDNDGGGGDASVTRKRKRQRSSSVVKQYERRLAAGLIQVTRQSWVSRVETFTDVPEHWPVPEPGDSVAYIVDLSGDVNGYQDGKGKAMAMSAVIKQKCTDAWTGGTGGSVTKATTVTLLGEGVKCQKLTQECRGAFLCAKAPAGLWKEYKRDDSEPEAVHVLPNNIYNMQRNKFKLECFERPVAFYNSVVKEKCQFDNGRCPGKAEFKHYFSINQGHPFVGCSAVLAGFSSTSGHIFYQIPRNVDQGLLVQLFSTGRINYSDTVIVDGSCTFTVPPRTGLKQKHCPHVHVQDGKIVEAVIQQRACPAKITIFSPVDHSIRKAIVIPAPGIPHNHPFYAWDKRTRREKAAARAAGHIVDQTSGDSDHISSHSPGVVDDKLNSSDMVAGDPLNPAFLSASPISTALVAPNYRLEQFYS